MDLICSFIKCDVFPAQPFLQLWGQKKGIDKGLW